MPLLISLAGILFLVFLILVLKLDTFISFIIVSIGLGLASGMDIQRISASIEKGIGNTLGSLVIILGFGAMLGKLVAESGAAQQITHTLTRLFGVKYMQWGMALSGLIIGIPLFYNAGFVVVVPLIFAIGYSTQLPLLFIGIPMLAALSVAHGFLPPHPSPTAIAAQLHADLGKTMIYGFMVAIPTIILAGPIFARTLKKYHPSLKNEMVPINTKSQDQLPSLGTSLLIALMPLVLLTLTTVYPFFLPARNGFSRIIDFLGDANMAMLISVLAAIYWLGLRRGLGMKTVMKHLEEAVKAVSLILLIIAGSGVFMQVMSDGGVNTYIAGIFQHMHIPPLILGWMIAALIRVCIGSATVAGLTTVGIIFPLLQHQPIHPELMVLSIGAGSLMFSHVNDGGFWLFKEYFNVSVKETFLTWSIMETIVSVSGLIGVLILNKLI